MRSAVERNATSLTIIGAGPLSGTRALPFSGEAAIVDIPPCRDAIDDAHAASSYDSPSGFRRFLSR
jgi:hypothetical protein